MLRHVGHTDGSNLVLGPLIQGVEDQVATSSSRKGWPPRTPLIRFDDQTVAQMESGPCKFRFFL